jgi:hypothetical protein
MEIPYVKKEDKHLAAVNTSKKRTTTMDEIPLAVFLLIMLKWQNIHG